MKGHGQAELESLADIKKGTHRLSYHFPDMWGLRGRGRADACKLSEVKCKMGPET